MIRGLTTFEPRPGIDVFDLTDDILRKRWTQLIAAFAFASQSFSIPAGWFDVEFVPTKAERKAPAGYFRRVLRHVERKADFDLNHHILTVMKVCINFCLNMC